MTLTTLLHYLHPTIDAFTLPFISLHIRLRLLAFQPLALLIYLLNHATVHILTPPAHRPRTIYIPVRNNRTLRALVYPPRHLPTSTSTSTTHRSQIHVDIHGGAFMSGQPEMNHRFCQQLAAHDILVVSISYRFAPRWPFPAAAEDVRDMLAWVFGEGRVSLEETFGGDVKRITVGGASAGAVLALVGGLEEAEGVREDLRLSGVGRMVKGVVTFYAPVDLTVQPNLKPRPAGFPRLDPLWFLMPLFDVYADKGRKMGYARSVLLSPHLARRDQLPGRILMVVAGVDIVAREQVEFAARINEEGGKEKEKIEVVVVDGCWHGWLELPSLFIDEAIRLKVFQRCVEFLKEVAGRDEMDGCVE